VPRSKSSNHTRDKILLAALTIFSRRGYSEASMDEIAREAGITKGALYWHFQDKQALYEAVVDLVLKRQMEAISKPLAGLSSLEEKVEAVVRATIDFYRSNQQVVEFYSNMLFEGKLLTQMDLKKTMTEMYSSYRRELAGLLRESDLPEGLTPEIAAALLVSCLDGIFIQWALDPEAVDLDRLGEGIKIIFVGQGLRENRME
jgi:TetR/AcrR family acrAB operon transcriptional repressor